MDLKKIIIILFSFALLGCEDVVEVELPTSRPRLVIDASFGTHFDGNTPLTEGAVVLTLSAPFYETGTPPANDAIVFITDLKTDRTYEFLEVGDSGVYIPQTPWNPNFQVDYTLTVVYGGETYIGSTRLVPTVTLDEILQGDATLFSGDETEIIVKFTDKAATDDHYLFDLDFNLYLTTEDRFYQGKQFVFSYFYEDIDPGQEITVKINGVDQQFYNYMTLLVEQSGQNGGGPFQTFPSTIRGNMLNISAPENYPFGYFSLSETNSMSLLIE